MALWTLGLVNSCLWGLSRAQRPRWYYGELEPPSGVTREPPHLPVDLALTAQALLQYGYWLIIGTLAAMTITSVGLFLRQLPHLQKATARGVGRTGLWGARGKRQPSPAPKHPSTEPAWPAEEDPEGLALTEALHLLDAVMEKTWHHLRHLERRRGGRRGAQGPAGGERGRAGGRQE